jgi:hypothetical protein
VIASYSLSNARAISATKGGKFYAFKGRNIARVHIDSRRYIMTGEWAPSVITDQSLTLSALGS